MPAKFVGSVRPFRCLYLLAVTVAAYLTLGWAGAGFVFLGAIDLEIHRK